MPTTGKSGNFTLPHSFRRERIVQHFQQLKPIRPSKQKKNASGRQGLHRLVVFILCLMGLMSGALKAQADLVPGPTFAVGSVSGASGSQVLVPVTVQNFTNILTVQFSLHWEPTNAILI